LAPPQFLLAFRRRVIHQTIEPESFDIAAEFDAAAQDFRKFRRQRLANKT
jgi:hypothetical protein